MTDHPYAPPAHPADDDHAREPALDRLACPSCSARGVSFWRVWMCGSLLTHRCAHCSTRLRVEKVGILKFAGYAIGAVIGAVLVLNVRNAAFSWWAFAVLAGFGFALDAWCDSRVVRLALDEPDRAISRSRSTEPPSGE